MKRVMFKDTYGSVGTVDETDHGNGRHYVTWNYGKSDKGEFITSIQGYDASYVKNNLIDITEDLFQEYINLRAWSEEQKDVQARIMGMAKVDEARKCRSCAFWAADPDGEYCAHDQSLKISPAGISLPRARGNLSHKPEKPEDDPGFSICGPEGKLWENRPEAKVRR